jgi:hypothetical protein
MMQAGRSIPAGRTWLRFGTEYIKDAHSCVKCFALSMTYYSAAADLLRQFTLTSKLNSRKRLVINATQLDRCLPVR